MVFSSLTFICLFFPLFFILYYLFKSRAAKNSILLIFSLIFYAWGEVAYIWLLLFSIFINWLLAIFIDRAKRNSRPLSAKLITAVCVIFNLLIIGVYKYAGFIVNTINSITGMNLDVPSIALPVGISFFTFQILSYVIDVYRGDVKVQRNIGIVAVYVSSFPQLIAGPIVRYSTVENELMTRECSADDIKKGIQRFITGLSKKVLIANTVASVADGIFSYTPEQYGILGAWIAVIAYTLQIYYDFSGYSDMAIGMGLMMGFHYDENFNYPYSAVSVTDFWRRWHISLSSFFRDYVYIPLGGNRTSTTRWIFNMMIVWMLTGLWHGASMNFVLWGLYYGILLICEKKIWGKYLEKIPSFFGNVIRRIYTIAAFGAGWVIFRTENITDIGKIFAAMFGRYGFGTDTVSAGTILMRSGAGTIFIVAVILGIIFSVPRQLPEWFKLKPTTIEIVKDTVSFALLVCCVIGLETGSYNPFIYFRF